MPTIYTIRLNLGGDIVERLTLAEQILDRINAKAAKGVRVTGTGTGKDVVAPGNKNGGERGVRRTPYPYIPPRAMPGIDMFYRRSYQMGTNLSREQFTERFNNAFQSIHRFRSDFIKNTFSVSGWGRNLGNFTSAIGSVGKAAAAAVPGLMSAVGAFAAAFAVLKVAPTAIGGLAYNKAKKVLFSEEMTEAIGQRAQFNLARSGLDENYSQAYGSASAISSSYGFNRAQVLGTINTLSGIDGVDMQMAANLARVAGKVAQFGSRPFDIVALNLQQILSAGGKPNARDIRELLHAAPILNRYAQEDMKKQNITGMDSREYLASDQSALLRVLQRFDKEYEPSEIARVRGLVDLEKADRWIKIEEDYQDFFRVTGEQVLRMEQAKTNFAEKFQREVDVENFETVTMLWTSFMDGLYDFAAGAVADVIDLAAKLGEWGDGLGLSIKTSWKFLTGDFLGGLDNIWGAITNDGIPRTNYEKARFDQDINEKWVGLLAENALSEDKYASISPIAKDSITQKAIQDYAPLARGGWEEKPSETPYEWQEWNSRPTKDRGLSFRNLPDSVRALYPYPDGTKGVMGVGTPSQNTRLDEILNGVRDSANAAIGEDWGNIGNNKNEGTDTEEIEDLTKGSKALFINFNAPVVQFDNTYNTGADVEAIRSVIERDIDEGVSRALQLTLYNTTRQL